MSRTVAIREDEELGKIYFLRSLRAKRINIKILPDRLEVVLPQGTNETAGMLFLESVRDKLRRKQAVVATTGILITEHNPLQTLTFQVEVIAEERKDIFSSMKSGLLTIRFPENLQVEAHTTQQYFWNSIDYFLRREAQRILPERTYALAEKHGFNVSNVKIRASRSRWGSCNSNRVINLSFYLLLLPQHLIDYVLLHELCHTVEMNHSPKFWKLLDQVSDGKNNEYKRELRRNSIPK